MVAYTQKHWQEQLFIEGLNTYAVFDGTRTEQVRPFLEGQKTDWYCLYPGNLKQEVREAAPYIFPVQQSTELLNLLWQGFGDSQGIFVQSTESLGGLWLHFQHFLLVDDDNWPEPVLFRFYDPRVLQFWLPAAPKEHQKAFSTPLEAVLAEGHIQNKEKLLQLSYTFSDDVVPAPTPLTLTAAEASALEMVAARVLCYKVCERQKELFPQQAAAHANLFHLNMTAMEKAESWGIYENAYIEQVCDLACKHGLQALDVAAQSDACAEIYDTGLADFQKIILLKNFFCIT